MSEKNWKDVPDVTGFWWRGLPGDVAELVWVDTFQTMPDAFAVKPIQWGGESEVWRKEQRAKGYHLASDLKKKLPHFKWCHLPSELIPA